jgi:hypothetical protein
MSGFGVEAEDPGEWAQGKAPKQHEAGLFGQPFRLS